MKNSILYVYIYMYTMRTRMRAQVTREHESSVMINR